MLRRILPLLLVAGALLLVGCSKSETPTNNASATNGNANKADSGTAPGRTGSTSVVKVGVPECDDFIAAYDACIADKVPETARAEYKAGIEQWRSSWRKLAENPQARASLAATCKQSAEQTRLAMKNYGCTF